MTFDDFPKSATELESYLKENFYKVYDLFTQQTHSDLVASKSKLYNYIMLNRNIIIELNIAEKTNLAFISLLLDICEKLGLLAPFRFLFDHLKDKEYDIGVRLKAASFYLIGVRTADDYINRYKSIFKYLQLAVETEEDNTDRALTTLVNYYAQVIYDFGEFNSGKVLELKTKIEKSLSQFEFSFLHNKLIEDVLSVDFVNFSDGYLRIHQILDSFLGRDVIKPDYRKESLFENGTDYCDLLASVAKSYNAVRQISVSKYQLIKSDSIFNSIGRGVAILSDENQLYAYMNSYGNMHSVKLIEAFKTLPRSLFHEESHILDWGCGQAIASMVYFDYLDKINLEHKVKNLTLVEPSVIALKRAALHVKFFSPGIDLHTINKDFDNLLKEDFLKGEFPSTIHFFSNILDIEEFSLVALLRLIDSIFRGSNLFICVSPYVNDTRTSRLDAFVKFFAKNTGFKMICSIDSKSGQWICNWSRVVRIFQVSL